MSLHKVYHTRREPKNVPIEVRIATQETPNGVSFVVQRTGRGKELYFPPGCTTETILGCLRDNIRIYGDYCAVMSSKTWKSLTHRMQDAIVAHFTGVWVWHECKQPVSYVMPTEGDDGLFSVFKLTDGHWKHVSDDGCDAGAFTAYFDEQSTKWVILDSSKKRVFPELTLQHFCQTQPHSLIFVTQQSINKARWENGYELDDTFLANGSFHIIHPDSVPARLRAAITWKEGKSASEAELNLRCMKCGDPAGTWRKGCFCIAICGFCASKSKRSCNICQSGGGFVPIRFGSPTRLADLAGKSAYISFSDKKVTKIPSDGMMQEPTDWFVSCDKIEGAREAYMLQSCANSICFTVDIEYMQPIPHRLFVDEKLWEQMSPEFQHLLCFLSEVFVCDRDPTHDTQEAIRLHLQMRPWICECGDNAIMLQDCGCIRLCRRCAPEFEEDDLGFSVPFKCTCGQLCRSMHNTLKRRRNAGPERKESLEEKETACCVCLESFGSQDVDRVLLEPCGHAKLCRACATRIFRTTRQCPTCRQQFNAHVRAFI